jgi:hypothetical protein
MDGQFTDGKADAGAHRWLLQDYYPFYVVNVWAGDQFSVNFMAVIDDFGNLVRVR